MQLEANQNVTRAYKNPVFIQIQSKPLTSQSSLEGQLFGPIFGARKNGRRTRDGNFFAKKSKLKWNVVKDWQQMVSSGFHEELIKASFGSIVTFLVL